MNFRHLLPQVETKLLPKNCSICKLLIEIIIGEFKLWGRKGEYLEYLQVC